MTLDPAQIASLVARPEGKQLEKKRGLPLDDKLARTLAAFANARGGVVLLGVDERHGVVGAPRPSQCIERLQAVARERITPELGVRAGSAPIDGGTVVWCSVPLSPWRPHSVRRDDGVNEIVVRVGSKNRAATAAMLERIRVELAGGNANDPLARDVLDWLARRDRGGAGSIREFAASHAVGLPRARGLFERLERTGLIVGHGLDSKRAYELPRATRSG